KAVWLRQAGLRTIPPDAQELRDVRFRHELLPRHPRARSDQTETPGLDLARHLDGAVIQPDLDPARRPQGRQGRNAVRYVDVERHHHRVCDPGIPVCDTSDRAVRGWLVLPLVSAARTDLRRLGDVSLVEEDSRLLLAPDTAAVLDRGRRLRDH